MRNNENSWLGAVFAGLFGLVVAALIIGSIFIGIYRSTSHHQVTFTVNKTETVATRNDGSQGHVYMIYTDQGTFKDTDSLLNGKFNSSDIYGQLIPGHKYSCDVTGFRFQYGSDYPNIMSCNEAK